MHARTHTHARTHAHTHTHTQHMYMHAHSYIYIYVHTIVSTYREGDGVVCEGLLSDGGEDISLNSA